MATFDLSNLTEISIRNKRAAAACAILRWKVVPWQFRDGRKVPTRKGWTGPGMLEGAEIGEWFVNRPDDIPGIVTGAESGFWVLDIDPRNGGTESFNRLDQIGSSCAQTFRVETPGGGWHLYFTWPAGITIPTTQLKHIGYPGLDVKGHGGFVSAPGSAIHMVGEYVAPIGPSSILDAPDWLIEIVSSRPSTFVVDGEDHSDKDGTEDGDQVWLTWQLTEVSSAEPGSQHEALRRFTFQMRRRGMRRAEAESWAIAVCERFTPEPGKSPWTAEDAVRAIDYTWARIAPGIIEAELANWAENTAVLDEPPAVVPDPPPIVTELPPPAPPLPPPPPNTAPASVAGEQPTHLGGDDENSQDLYNFARNRLMWLAGAGIWYVWDGKVWQSDDEVARNRIVQELGVELQRRGAEAGPDGFVEFARRAARLGTVNGRNACLDYGRDLFAVNVSKLDADVNLINTPTGLLNIETGKIRPATPEDYVTRMTRAEYDPDAYDETWERVLQEMIPNEVDRRFFQRWAGYCLTGRTQEKVILALHGPAGSGKSTVSEPFSRAMGDYAALWQPDVIVDRSGVNIDEAMYRVRGARIVSVSEMRRGTRLNEGVIKYATGADSVAARGLYMNSIEYRPQFKLWVHTNFVPDSSDDALITRFGFLKMGRKLERGQQNPRIKEYLELDADAQRAIMAWAVRGWHMVLEEGGVGRPENSDAEAMEHLLQSDPVRRFISEVLVRSEGAAVETSSMFAAYEAWCISERIPKPLGPTKFAKAMEERGIEKQRIQHEGSRHHVYQGWEVVSQTPIWTGGT